MESENKMKQSEKKALESELSGLLEFTLSLENELALLVGPGRN